MFLKKKTFQTILITGASSGIGRALAHGYAAPNITLYLSGRNQKALEQVKQQCQKKGSIVHDTAFDISNDQALSNYIQTIIEPLDLIIANAGASGGNRLNGDPESLETINTLINVNLKAPIRLTRLLMDMLMKQQHGHLVYISSVQALRGFPHSPTYCATKAGLKAYSEGLRAWIKNKNIDVSIVYPGFIKTAMSDRLDSPKPLMMSAEKAAKHIQSAVAKNHTIIKLPKLIYYSVRLLDLLPIKWADFILSFSKVDVPEPRK